MKNIDVYDFDGTLYSKDSSIQFFMYCMKNKITIIKYVPGIIIFYLLYLLKVVNKEKLKEYFFKFLKEFKDVNVLIKDFWKINKKYLRLNILNNNNNNKKIVVSASPDFLLNDICKEIGIDCVIASKVSVHNGKLKSLNCYGREKIKRLNLLVENYKIINFYGDSMSDNVLAEHAEHAYFLKNDNIYKWNEQKFLDIKNILNNIIYIYLIIPVIIFLLGWTKAWLSIPLSIALILSMILGVIKCKSFITNIKEYIYNNFKEILITLSIALLIVFLSGIGGFVYQNFDHLYRNAIFTELVNNNWPIYLSADGSFTKDVIMVYYFALWLPAALIGKIFGIKVGLLFLYLWCVIGVYIVIRYFKIYYKNSFFIPILLFIGFSGLDIVENIMSGSNILSLLIYPVHLEWGTGYQFSSFTTQLFWVFNQAIPAWLITLLILNEQDNKKLIILISTSLIFSTLPTVGLMFALIYKLYFSKSEKLNLKRFINSTKEMISFENLLIGIPLFIIFLTFIISNSTSNNIELGVSNYNILSVIVTIIFEYLIYYCFVFKYCKDKKLIFISLISLIICPFVSINGGGDFCMRASIPGLLILFILLLESLSKMNKKSIDYKIFLIIFVLGMITPFNEIRRTVINTNTKTKMESIKLITSEHQQNFYGYKDESLFVKYFAKYK